MENEAWSGIRSVRFVFACHLTGPSMHATHCKLSGNKLHGW